MKIRRVALITIALLAAPAYVHAQMPNINLLQEGPGKTEEQIEQRAQRIAEKNKAVEDAVAALAAPPPGAPAPTPRRPGEQLKPGAAPPSPPPVGDEDYPQEWLSPSQRARVQQVRERTTT